MGCPPHQLPSLEKLSELLLRNRTAGMLGLLPEEPTQQSRNDRRQLRGLLEGEGSLLPLDANWADSQVHIDLLMNMYI